MLRGWRIKYSGGPFVSSLLSLINHHHGDDLKRPGWARLSVTRDLGNIRDKVTAVARHHLFILRGNSSDLCLNTEMPREGELKQHYTLWVHPTSPEPGWWLQIPCVFLLGASQLSLNTLRCHHFDVSFFKKRDSKEFCVALEPNPCPKLISGTKQGFGTNIGF